MNMYVDKDYSPKYERGATEFDKYVQTSDQELEDSEEDFQEQSDYEEISEDSTQFDPKVETQLDQ